MSAFYAIPLLLPHIQDGTPFHQRVQGFLRSGLIKRRTVLNVRKKKRRTLYAALADSEALREAAKLHESGVSCMETEHSRYADAVAVLETCGIFKENLRREKAELYEKIAAVNREIREQRKRLAMCAEILSKTPEIEATGTAQGAGMISGHSECA